MDLMSMTVNNKVLYNPKHFCRASLTLATTCLREAKFELSFYKRGSIESFKLNLNALETSEKELFITSSNLYQEALSF